MRQSWKRLLTATGLAGIVGYGSKLLCFVALPIGILFLQIYDGSV